MGKPIATTTGICFAFPDVLLTPVPGSSPVKLPYPNVAQLSSATGTATTVKAGGKPVILEDSEIPTSTGGEAASAQPPDKHLDKCTFTGFSKTVKVGGKGVVRQGDPTEQNAGNASGQVMAGLPTVLVGD